MWKKLWKKMKFPWKLTKVSEVVPGRQGASCLSFIRNIYAQSDESHEKTRQSLLGGAGMELGAEGPGSCDPFQSCFHAVQKSSFT